MDGGVLKIKWSNVVINSQSLTNQNNSNRTPRLYGHFSIFGFVFFVLKSLLGIARQQSRKNFEPKACLESCLNFNNYIERGLLTCFTVTTTVHVSKG